MCPAHHLDSDHAIDCDVLVFSDDIEARRTIVELCPGMGLRGLAGGALANSAAAEALTSILIYMNKTYKADGAGIRFTNLTDAPAIPVSAAAPTCWVLIPVKAPGEGKTRLAGVLDARQREQLVAAMLRQVITAARDCDAIARICLVSSADHGLGDFVTRIHDHGRGLNPALADAMQELTSRAPDRVIIVAADLPQIAPADLAMLADVPDHAIGLAPDRHGTGTNAVSVSPARPSRLYATVRLAQLCRASGRSTALGIQRRDDAECRPRERCGPSRRSGGCKGLPARSALSAEGEKWIQPISVSSAWPPSSRVAAAVSDELPRCAWPTWAPMWRSST